MTNLGREDIGWVCAGHPQQHDKPVMIYVINSARYTLSFHLLNILKQNNPVLLIADECHHYASTENRKIFSFLQSLDEQQKKNFFALGLSATPQVSGFDAYLAPSLGPLIYTYGFSEAMADRVINQVVIYNIALRMTEEQTQEYEELSAMIKNTLRNLTRLAPYLAKLNSSTFFVEVQKLCLVQNTRIADTANRLMNLFYQRRALVYEAPQRLDCALSLIMLLDKKSKIIIFGERISQSELLYERLKHRFPNQVAQYHSDLGETEKILALRRYRSGEARILVSCKALDEGLDIPSADVGIVLASTSVQRQRIQRLGRILRLQEDKGKASLFYLCLDQTVEDNELLDQGIIHVQEWYLTYTDHFTHAEYDDLSANLLNAMTKKQKQIEGIDAILDAGRVRNDWFDDPELLQKKALTAKNPTMQRYYSCMRTLSLLRLNSE